MVMMAIFSCDSGALALAEEIGIRVGLGLGQGELVRQRGDTEAMTRGWRWAASTAGLVSGVTPTNG